MAAEIALSFASSSPKIDRKDSSAVLKVRLNMAFESMKEAAAAAAGTSTILPILSPSLSLSTVGTVKTEYFCEGEENQLRDEIHNVHAEMDSMREGVDVVVMPEIPHTQSSMSILTQKAAETNNYWPTISRSTSTTTSSLSLWDSIMSTNSEISANSMGYLSANTTTSTSGDFFSVGCPIPMVMSLSYSNSVEGLEIVPTNTNTMLSISNSLAYSESIGDTVTLVHDDDDHVKIGCLVAVKGLAIEVKSLADDITLVACDARDFYNSPRKSVTFTHFSPTTCGD